MMGFTRRKGRTGYPKDFEVFYAARTDGGPIYSCYLNGSEQPYMTGRYEWKAICPHGEACWSDAPGAFFCLGTVDEPFIIDPGTINLHQVMHTEYLHSCVSPK